MFYARAYDPAILVGSQQPWISKQIDLNTILNYTETDISFVFKDPGMYTIEVVLESIFTPDVYSLPLTPHVNYDGFLLRDFPLFLNVTVTSKDDTCETANACNMPLCTSKDVESDLTTLTARWIFSGHMSSDDIKSRKNIPNEISERYADGINGLFTFEDDIKSRKDIPNEISERYAVGINRLGLRTDYAPMNCVLAPMRSAINLLDACVEHTGLHFIFIGDSVTKQHIHLLPKLLNNTLRYRVSYFSFSEYDHL
jgi:hypothetical protein